MIRLLPPLGLLLATVGLTLLAFNGLWLPILASTAHSHTPGVRTLHDFCPSDVVQSKYNWSPFPGANFQLCLLTSFFQNTISAPLGPPLAISLSTSLLPPLLLLQLESLRPSSPLPLRYPTLWLFFAQNAGLALVLPLWAGCLLLFPASRAPVPARKAEAAAFGILLGYVIPSIAMFSIPDYRIGAVWQFFPLFVAVFRMLYSSFRPASSESRSKSQPSSLPGKLYLGSLVICALAHLYILSSTLLSLPSPSLPAFLSRLGEIYLPSPLPTPTAETYLPTLLKNFFKQDNIYVFLSTVFGVLFSFPRLGRQGMKLLMSGKWVGAAVVAALLGPGAGMALLCAEREGLFGAEKEE